MSEEDVYLEVDDAEEWMHSAVLENDSGDEVIDVVETALDAVFTEGEEATEEEIDESIEEVLYDLKEDYKEGKMSKEEYKRACSDAKDRETAKQQWTETDLDLRLSDGYAASELLAALLGNPGVVFDGMHEVFRTEKFERKVRQIGQEHNDRLRQLAPKALKVLKRLKEDEALKAMGILMGEKDDHVQAWLDAYSRLERNLAAGRRRAVPSPKGKLDQPDPTTAAAAPEAPQNLAASRRRAAPVPQGKSDQLDCMTAAAVRDDPQKAGRVVAACGDGGTAVHQAMAKAIRLQLEEQHDEARQEWLAIAGMASGKDDALEARAFYSAAYLIEEYDAKFKARDMATLDETMSLYDKALELKPDFADALCGRGNTRLTMEQSSQITHAMDDYNKALKISPKHADALVGRGAARTCLGHLKRAIRDLNKALDIKPGFAEALCWRGYASLHLDQHKEAITDFNKALSVKPGFVEALYGLGYVRLAMGRYKDAIAYCDKALSIRPDFAEALLLRSEARTGMKHLEEALDDCNKALRINPYFAMAFQHRAYLKDEMGRFRASVNDFNKALSVDGIKECNETLRTNPERADTLNWRGVHWACLKEYDKAIEDCDRALSIEPDYAFAFSTRGSAKLKLGDYAGAVDDLEKALELYAKEMELDPDYAPQIGDVKRHLAKASAKLAKQRAKGKS